MATGSNRAIIAAMLANLGIAIAKFVAFLLTGASSMLAESIHSVADTSNQGLLLFGGRRSRRLPTLRHPFGYGPERYFWSFVVALVLFSMGGLFALYEGIEKIRHPHELDSPMIAVVVLLIGIALEGYSFRTAMHEAGPLKGTQTWWGFIRHAKTPELPVVLLEDAGALTGLVLALGGVGMAHATGDPTWDGIGTVAIGALLVAIAIILAVEMQSLLIGEGASAADLEAIHAAIEHVPAVERLIHVRTLHLGPDELLIAAKIEMPDGLPFEKVADVVDQVEAEIRARVRSAKLIYLEPDILDE